MNKIAAFVIIVIIVAGGLWYVGYNQKNEHDLFGYSWYENEELGFKFPYPKEFGEVIITRSAAPTLTPGDLASGIVCTPQGFTISGGFSKFQHETINADGTLSGQYWYGGPGFRIHSLPYQSCGLFAPVDYEWEDIQKKKILATIPTKTPGINALVFEKYIPGSDNAIVVIALPVSSPNFGPLLFSSFNTIDNSIQIESLRTTFENFEFL